MPLTGSAVDEDLPVQTGDEDLLGQIDGVEDGEVSGWACLKGYMGKPLEVHPFDPFEDPHRPLLLTLSTPTPVRGSAAASKQHM